MSFAESALTMITQHPGTQAEIAILMNSVTGSRCNLLRGRKPGVLSRHIHPSWFTGCVIRGACRCLEHDWAATAGAFVDESPGEIHTLVVDEGVGGDHIDQFAR